MVKLLPLLEKLSQVHCVAAVQELAFGLRSVIATHGAYRPEDLTRPNFSFTGRQKPPPRADRPPMPPHGSASHCPPPSMQEMHSGSSGGASGGGVKAFSDLLLEALDPDVPTRAAALRTLTHMLQNKTAEALQAQEKILNVSEALRWSCWESVTSGVRGAACQYHNIHNYTSSVTLRS